MKKKKNTMLSFLLVGIGITQVLAQEHPVSSGGDATGAGGSVSYTIGEIDYITTTGLGGTISQGVQQPFEFFTVSIDPETGINLSAAVYPNPTNEYITLTITNTDLNNMYYSLLDLQGKAMSMQIIQQSTTQIDMGFLSDGIYLLGIYNNNKEIKTFKIIKN